MKNVSKLINQLKRNYPELADEPMLDELEMAAAGDAEPDAEDPEAMLEGDEWEMPPEDAYQGPDEAPLDPEAGDGWEDEEAPKPKAKRKSRMPF